MKKTVKSQALILKRTNYGEADRIVQILTPEHGKMSVMAKGVRKQKSKLAPCIELFCLSTLVIHFGKGKLGILTSATIDQFYDKILQHYDRLQYGYEILKRTKQLSEHVQEKRIFDFLHTSLETLNTPSIDLRIIQAWSYLHYADLSGHSLNISRDNANQPLSADSTYQFDIAEMSFIKDENGRFGAEHLKLLKILTLKKPQFIAKISGIDAYIDDCLSLAHAVSE